VSSGQPGPLPRAHSPKRTPQLTTAEAADQALEAVSTQAAMELIKSLPREQAEIIMLRVVVGLDAGDVAKIVGKTPGAVRVAAHRGLRRLAGQVAKAGVTL
jgi:RNA polymerase sigma-70 factor (ECF subfamily)